MKLIAGLNFGGEAFFGFKSHAQEVAAGGSDKEKEDSVIIILPIKVDGYRQQKKGKYLKYTLSFHLDRKFNLSSLACDIGETFSSEKCPYRLK